MLESLASRLRRRAQERQRTTSLLTKTKWAFVDRRRLESLVDNIKDGVDDLVDLFPALVVQQRQAAVADAHELVQPADIEEPEEDSELVIETVRQIAADVDPVLQGAVEIAAEHGRANDTFKNMTFGEEARTAFGNYVANGYSGPAPPPVDRHRTFDNLTFGKKARTTFGDTYGGKGVFDD